MRARRVRTKAMTKVVAIAVAVAAMTTCLAGCAGLARDDRTPTGGRSLSVRSWAPAERRIAYYEIDREGIFGTSGGVDAEIGEVTWSTPLEPAEFEWLLDPLSEASWWAQLDREIENAPPDASTDPPRTLVRFVGPLFDRERTFRGEIASIAPLLARLREIAMGRFEETLDALPRAGERFPD